MQGLRDASPQSLWNKSAPGRRLPLFQLEKERSEAVWESPPLNSVASCVYIEFNTIYISIYSLWGRIAVLELTWLNGASRVVAVGI